MNALKRLSLLDCIAIGINGIVGSGIFFLPRWVADGALYLSPLAFLACGALCMLIALCFAEVSGMFERSGGPYLYAREAFGEFVGFCVAWMSAASGVLGFAAVARALGDEIARALGDAPAANGPYVAWALVAVLAGLNFRAIKTGANTSNLLTVAKLLPLLAFVAIGLFHFDQDTFVDLGRPTLGGFGAGVLSSVYALSGFEFVSVVAGETENPRRSIPLAIVGSLLGAVGLYALIQLVCAATLPTLTHSDAPLVDAATSFGGANLGKLIRVGAIVSMTGFCSGSVLVIPRYFSTLAQDGILPRALGRTHPTRGTPYVAIVFVAVACMALLRWFDFKALADLTVIALFAQYVPTCLALIVFRRTRPDAPRTFRVPGGPVIPVISVSLLVYLTTRLKEPELRTGGIILGIGALVFFAVRFLKKGTTPAAPPAT